MKPFVFYADRTKLFSQFEDGDCILEDTYDFAENFIKLEGRIWRGFTGIEGSMALRIPPRDHDIDAWEGSCSAGTEDGWAFLGFMSVPNGAYEIKLIFFLQTPTFFYDDYKIIYEICGSQEDLWAFPLGYPIESQEELLQEISYQEWKSFWRILELHLGAKRRLPRKNPSIHRRWHVNKLRKKRRMND
jgi:hypothetical protein